MTAADQQKKLKELGEKLKTASPAQAKRLWAQLDKILGMEASPEPKDEDAESQWEKNRR